jgi:hypothetical protein
VPTGVTPSTGFPDTASLSIMPLTISPFRLDIATGGTNPNTDDLNISPSNATIVVNFTSNLGGVFLATLTYNPATGSTRTVSASPQDSSGVWKLAAYSNGQTSNTETVVIVPPQKFIQVLIGEAQAQLATNDLLSPTAVAIVIRNRILDSANRWPKNYNDNITLDQFRSVTEARFINARNRATAQSLTAYDNAVRVAADVFGGVEQANLGNSLGFGSPGVVGATEDIANLILYANTTPCPFRQDAKTLGFSTDWFPRFSFDQQVLLINEIPVETFVFIRERPADACSVIKAGIRD